MAWTGGSNKSTGDVITAAIWNNYLGASGSIDETAPAKVTTAGDIVYATGANALSRLGIGSASNVLKTNSGATAPEWGTIAASDLTGWGNDKVIYTGNSGTLTELALGASGEVLTSNGATAAPTFAAAGGSQELKVWCNWNNVGTNTIFDSYNVTSVTDGGGVAESDFLWDTDFANANYALAGICEGSSYGGAIWIVYKASTKIGAGVTTYSVNYTGVYDESPSLGIAGWGDQ